MGLFLSTYINRVDKKGRVSVPATFRTALELPNLVIFKSSNHQALEGFSVTRMEELSTRLDGFDVFSDAQDDLATAIFAESLPLNIDGDGRIVLPQDLLDFAEINEEAAFIGMGTKFQIWAPTLFEKRKATARTAVKEQKLTLPSRTTD